MRYFAATTVVLVWILFGVILGYSFQASSEEAEVKATYLVNFAQFTQWPSQAFAGGDMPFTLCVMGESFDGVLDKAADGEMVGGRRIVVRRIVSSDDVRGCHMVYVGRLQARRSPEIINAADGMPVLTVGDSENFINAGGMIRFTGAGPKIRFEINPDAAERVSLRVSSRLLQLADIARPR